MKWFRSHIAKKLLWVVLILWLSGIFLNGHVGMGESVYAQDKGITTADSTTQTESWIEPADTGTSGWLNTMSLRQILNLLLKIIYIFLWPLLVLAGLSLDNTLVYASIFHMDAPLWKFWNMMKNFANFALWFMVLFAIIKSILTNSWEWSLKDEKSPLGIIKKTLIAGILIQASWFLMAVLVDVSTIATYAVGWLPLSILKNDDIGKMQIITVNSSINLDKFDIISAGGQWFDVWYTIKYKYWSKGVGAVEMKVSPCRIEDSFVIGRVKWWIGYKNSEYFDGTKYKENELCVLYGNKIVMRKEDAFMQAIKDNDPNETELNWNNKEWYDGILKILLKDIPDRQDQEWVHDYVVKLWWTTWSSAGLTTGQTFLDDEDTVTMQLSQLIDKSKWFVGPLVTIYSSLLNFAQLTDTDITSVGETSWIFIIKTWVALALFFPLLALAVVLIARIWLLWLFIVASPFIILKESFSGFLKLGKLDDYLSIKWVMGIVFAPVISVAALSLSLIFLTALMNGFNSSNPNDSVRFEQAFSAEKIEPIDNKDQDAIRFQWAATIQFSKLPRWDAMDRFSWLLINFFAIGLMWMIVFAAIKANKIWEGVWQKIQDFGGNMFKTLPIIPMPNWQSVGVGSMAKVLSEAPQRKLQAMETRDNQLVQSWFDGDNSKISKLDETQAKTIFTSWATQNTIEEKIQNLWAKKEEVAGIISGSVASIGAAVSLIQDEAEKNQVIAAVASAWWLEEGRYDEYLKNENIQAAKPAIDEISKDLANENTVKWVFETPTDENKPKIKKYFDAGATEHIVTTTDNKTYKITPSWNNDDTYTVVETTE